jgi:hypothetical protein
MILPLAGTLQSLFRHRPLSSLADNFQLFFDPRWSVLSGTRWNNLVLRHPHGVRTDRRASGALLSSLVDRAFIAAIFVPTICPSSSSASPG